MQNEEVVVSVLKGGKVLATLQKNSESKSLIDFDFQLDATEKGIQRYDISVKPISLETNHRNNFRAFSSMWWRRKNSANCPGTSSGY
ncbi:MAG: hypothetical protein IPJ20_08195 [Flammeovirgaceae bacterium]|nr:hypothetical protein [Flammeovirgaceae bacterium]